LATQWPVISLKTDPPSDAVLLMLYIIMGALIQGMIVEKASLPKS
jgi:hypothetical protein